MVFDQRGSVVAVAQKEHRQLYPQPGWVEHDPREIWQCVQEVIADALQKSGVRANEIAALGVTNQRETTVVWDRRTGEPVNNAIVWQDIRTADICKNLAAVGGQDQLRRKVGLPLATYFSGPKLRWILDHLSQTTRVDDLLFGTIDTWLIWHLTGGPDGGVHVTDVSNASRTMLMNLETLAWDPEVLQLMGIPRSMLPTIKSSSEIYGEAHGLLAGVPVASDLGDQQAALFGQACFAPGEAKNTYGTGCFMLLNTGAQIVHSKAGLLTTVAYKLGQAKAVYALEGSIAIAGALVQWLRDNLGLIENSAGIEALARTVEDSGGIFFVPAFSGLFAPHWRDDARGVIVGLTRYVHKGHIARAALEATAFQTREVLDAMNADAGVPLRVLKVDGGMVRNELLMQFQADILGVPVLRAAMSETTALGAAYAAGLAVGFWTEESELRDHWSSDREWRPTLERAEREQRYADWKRAVMRTFDWAV